MSEDQKLPETIPPKLEDMQVDVSNKVLKKVKNKATNKESLELVEDKRKRVSKYNRFAHGQSTDLPAYCDTCVFRSKESGGGGQCPKYKEGSTCVLRKDLAEMFATYSTREPEDLKNITDQLIKLKLEDVYMAELISRMDGNLPDKSSRAELNSLVQLLKLSKDLNIVEIKATETTKTGADGLEEIMRQVIVKRQQGLEDDKAAN